ncbi:uncharacterized protein PFL1_05626 [Pseudozyma flocculosa PF-1]|uniref:Related to RUD3 - suppressor of uso1-1 transport defect n=2 Tax=Pseudozyma flocculosa TaxID=84751 RepID=A0A5C3FB39_9BASI|nr:uncharacterized protein PFL1_05626 [Pseudozyma flocculosa PF-1]EPQ26990.1 hypothetical protein PFL1_05626 [Pseudozyma flocculosa PF-1]SPO40681.1 related to RUD3 - suppressor of uso1-1 transport defect [Pseudozyma flocculosa]
MSTAASENGPSSPRASTELHVNGTATSGENGRISISSSSSLPPPSQASSQPPDEAVAAERTPISAMSDADVRAELERVREERDGFESQYRGLLAKLTQMRSTLGDRLRQDAEELDRREHQIDELTSRTAELEATVSTLKEELVSSHAETERITAESDSLRATIAASSATSASTSQDVTSRLERERELQEMLERLKMDCEGWETACLEERARREELEATAREAQSDKERAEQRAEAMRQKAEREEQSARELQAVLEEFQSAQESELRRALGDQQEAYETLTLSLSQHKARADQAESQLAQYEAAAKQSQSLSAEVREKNLLIGKLRHEAVILNEHLTEALRRLRNDGAETNVDRKLVTNLLLQFLTTPRTDGKRFEMLNLIASVLGWSDTERETAGLQKIGGGGSSRGGGWGIGVQSPSKADGKGKGHARSAVAGDESFSNLFVEFLLSEAEAGGGTGGTGSGPPTPARKSISSPSAATTPDGSSRRPSIPSLTQSLSSTSIRADDVPNPR